MDKTDYFLWQFMHKRLPETARPSTVVAGASFATHSMCFGPVGLPLASTLPLRLCGSWQLVQPTASLPVPGILRRGMMRFASRNAGSTMKDGLGVTHTAAAPIG